MRRMCGDPAYAYIHTKRCDQSQKRQCSSISTMSAQRAITRVKRAGKEAYKFQFTSTYEYITLECNGTWRPTMLKVVWFRNHRRVESIPVQLTLAEDRGPNGALIKAKFKPPFSVGLVVTLYKKKFNNIFEGKEYKYYIQDESQKGIKVLASFTLDLKDYTDAVNGDSRDVFDMTFHTESRKVHDVTMGMTLTSRLLKKGGAIDYDMQSTFSAMTSDLCSMQLDSDGDSEGERGEGMREGKRDKEVVLALEVPGSVQSDSDGNFKNVIIRDVIPEENEPPTGKGIPTVTSKQTATTVSGPTAPRITINTDSNLISTQQPIRQTSLSPSPSLTPRCTPSPPPPNHVASTQRVSEKTNKVKNTLKTIFGISSPRRVDIKSKNECQQVEEEEEEPNYPASPQPLSPLHTLTDSSHRPWEELAEMVKKLKETVERLENENRQLHASMEVQGWLFKRGIKGVTANVWRRRYFRVEGNKIYYYKTMCSPNAQGFIDLDLVLGVREVSADEQDKNCSTFLVRCEGRTYQLQAIDQPTMKKWMSAINFLANWRRSCTQGGDRQDTEHENLPEDQNFLNWTTVQ